MKVEKHNEVKLILKKKWIINIKEEEEKTTSIFNILSLYIVNNFASEWTVLPCFKSPTIVICFQLKEFCFFD